MPEYQLLPLPSDRRGLCVGGLLSRCSKAEREGPGGLKDHRVGSSRREIGEGPQVRGL